MRHIESQIQQNCVTWFRLQYPKIGRLLFAVPNGGARNAREAAIMKGEGVTAGVSDIILLYPSGGFHSLCIEFKTTSKSSKQTDYQKEWQALAEAHGSKYIVCRSLEDFQREIRAYMQIEVQMHNKSRQAALQAFKDIYGEIVADNISDDYPDAVEFIRRYDEQIGNKPLLG